MVVGEERGMERADPRREARDSREMRERELMRMERDRDRMERERMDRAERERDMRDSSMMRERRFLDRTPSGMERDPRGLESPAALGGRDRERERQRERGGGCAWLALVLRSTRWLLDSDAQLSLERCRVARGRLGQ